MDLPLSAYHVQSFNQMLELSETYSGFYNFDSIREFDADGDSLVDVSDSVSRILE